MEACILAYSRLPQQAPPALAGRLARALPYARRLQLRGPARVQLQSLAGLGLACILLQRATGRAVEGGELRFPRGGAPFLPGGARFSIAHAGEWVACALTLHGEIGLDFETPDSRPPFGTLAQWVAAEAVAKAAGAGLRALRGVQFDAPAVAHYAGRRWSVLDPGLPVAVLARIACDSAPAAVGLMRVPFVHACRALAGDLRDAA